MKKKKLKKKIKKLEKSIEVIIRDGREVFDKHRGMIETLEEEYTKLKEDLNRPKKVKETTKNKEKR